MRSTLRLSLVKRLPSVSIPQRLSVVRNFHPSCQHGINILLVCGGTGGHLAPGIATAETLVDRGHRCTLCVSSKDVDSRLLTAYPHLEVERCIGSGIMGHGILSKLSGLMRQAALIRQANHLIAARRVNVIIAFGGFLTAGFGVAARLNRIPLILHEANRVPGRVTRLVGRFAAHVFLPDAVQLKSVPQSRQSHAAVPVRRSFSRILSKDDAREKLNFPKCGRLLVVLGGSQGAQSLNQWAADNAEDLANRGWHLLCLTGMQAPPRGRIETAGHVAAFTGFSDDIPAVLNAADLAVTRAGAGTLAELIALKLPAILVPYPFAADNHQAANANFLSERGAAVTIDAAEPHRLLPAIESMTPDRLSEMIDAMKTLDGSNAANVIATTAESVSQH